MEHESTLEIPTTEAEYRRVRAANLGHTHDVVLVWPSGVRLSRLRYQRKMTTDARMILLFRSSAYAERHRRRTTTTGPRLPYWVPIVRTRALEESIPKPDPLDVTEHDITRQTHRLVLPPRADPTDDGIRVTHNQIVTGQGVRYTVEYEIEYGTESCTYEDITAAEQRLLDCCVARADLDKFEPARLAPPPIELDTMFRCVVTKLQMWHTFDPNRPYRWAYKWNGVKVKTLLTTVTPADGEPPPPTAGPLTVSCWSDTGSLGPSTLQVPEAVRSEVCALLGNVCCAVEIMADRAVLFEAVGAQYGDVIYSVEPAANCAFLDTLRALLSDGPATLFDRPLHVQQYFEPPLVSALPPAVESLCDGFVIAQGQELIRWKAPTIDVKCTPEPSSKRSARSLTPSSGPASPASSSNTAGAAGCSHHYTVGGHVFELDFAGVPGTVYEVASDGLVLRARTDRHAASSDREYRVFCASIKLLESPPDRVVFPEPPPDI